jgi:AAA+ ATPase superfamily predicted ATPase
MQRVALVVGVTQYSKLGLGNFPSFANNANAIADILEPTFKVRRLPEEAVQEDERVQVGKDSVSLKILQEQLKYLFTAADFDTVLFYFSGHGLLGKQPYPKTYLATSESELSDDGYRKAIEIDLIKSFLRDCPAREQIVWLDCCYGGDLVKFAKDLNDDKTRFIITASRSEDRAYEEIRGEMGVFTRELVEALARTGTTEELITCAAIEAAVREKLRTLPYPQMPQFYRNKLIEFWDRRVMTQENQDNLKQYSSAASNDGFDNSQKALHNVPAGRDMTVQVTQIMYGTRSSSNNVDSQENATQKSHSGNQFKPKKFIDRPQFEEVLWELIQQERQAILISAPQKMGKTWLVEKTINRARNSQYKVVQYTCYKKIFVSSNEFFKSLYKSMAEQLDMPSPYNENLVDSQNLEYKFMDNYVLPSSPSGLVIALDNFDYLHKNPDVYEEICGILRTWIEKGAPSNHWKRLKLILAISTQRLPEIERGIGSLLDSVITYHMVLKIFTNEEVKQLLDSYNLSILEEDLQEIMELVGNHPDLINSVLNYLCNYWKYEIEDKTVKQVLEKACTLEGVIFKDHLESLKRRIQEYGVVGAYQKILSGKRININDDERSKLKALGLIKYSDNSISSSCELYSKYFSDNL